MINTDQIQDLIANGADVIDSQGDKIGSLGQIYLDDQTNQPSWLTVNTGLFGMSESFVPLDNANVSDGAIHVGYTKDQVKDAPKMDPDGHLDPQEEDRLYAHYGQTDRQAYVEREGRTDAYAEGQAPVAGEAGYVAGTEQAVADQQVADQQVAADANREQVEGDSLVRSEERLNVGKEQHEAGRVRLRKYVVTENVTQTVPVSHEEVRVERTPLTGEAATGQVGELGEQEVSVTLHEERPVVSKETVPVEEVRLGKETVTENQEVSEQVRHEEIETVNDVEGVRPEDQRRDDV